MTEGICWNTENDGPAPQVEQIWDEIENKLDKSVVRSEELVKSWKKISNNHVKSG